MEDRLARLEAEVRLLRDKQEIYELLMKYCRGVDRCDEELIGSTFHADSIVPGTRKDPAHIVKTVRGTTKAALHFIGNVLIDVNGDDASSESYFISYLIMEREGRDYVRTRAARYLHRFERRSGEWRATDKRFLDEWNELSPKGEPAPGADRWEYGLRSRQDPVYEMQPIIPRPRQT